jgi:hypothetical protein
MGKRSRTSVDVEAGRRLIYRHRRMALGGAVAPPLVLVSATSQDFESNLATQVITLPTYSVGDLLVLVWNNSGASSETSTVSGWTAISLPASGSASNYHQAYFRRMTGSEGATVSVVQPIARAGNSLIWRITGASASVDPVGTQTFTNTTTATSLTPANLISGFGAVETVFLQHLAAASQDTDLGVSACVTGFPTGYTGTGTSTTHNAVAATGCGQGWASKKVTAASDAASAWTYNTTADAGVGSRASAIGIAVRGA